MWNLKHSSLSRPVPGKVVGNNAWSHKFFVFGAYYPNVSQVLQKSMSQHSLTHKHGADTPAAHSLHFVKLY